VTPSDAPGLAACSLFRDIAAGAFGETLSKSEIVAGLEQVGSLAEHSTRAIRKGAQKAREMQDGSGIAFSRLRPTFTPKTRG
jgi:hypothetical protein